MQASLEGPEGPQSIISRIRSRLQRKGPAFGPLSHLLQSKGAGPPGIWLATRISRMSGGASFFGTHQYASLRFLQRAKPRGQMREISSCEASDFFSRSAFRVALIQAAVRAFVRRTRPYAAPLEDSVRQRLLTSCHHQSPPRSRLPPDLMREYQRCPSNNTRPFLSQRNWTR